MKTAEMFWNVISDYNSKLLIPGLIIPAITLFLIILTHFKRNIAISSLVKIWFAAQSLYIGIVFFFIFDRSATALFLGGPLFILIGALLVYSAIHSREVIRKETGLERALYALITLYPLASFLLGHAYPKTVLLLMPCPLVSYIIVTYLRFSTRLPVLELLLLAWAITGFPKAFVFDVFEDTILFIAGLYWIGYRYYHFKIRDREQAGSLR